MNLKKKRKKRATKESAKLHAHVCHLLPVQCPLMLYTHIFGSNYSKNNFYLIWTALYTHKLLRKENSQSLEREENETKREWLLALFIMLVLLTQQHQQRTDPNPTYTEKVEMSE